MTDDNKDDNKTADNADVEVQQEETVMEESGVTMGKIHVSDAQVPMVGMFFCGLILLVAVLVPGKGLKFWAYGVSVASVAMVFALIGFGLTFSEDLNEKVGKFNAIFLFLWCFIGACILTFSGPFLTTGNGYFASWGLAVSSILGVGVTGSEAKSVVGKMGALLGLGASSVVVLIASAQYVKEGNPYRNASIYALCLACITVFVVGFFQRCGDKSGGKVVKVTTLGFFAINWVVMACIVTFDGPFLTTGNGYFGSWGGAITSVLATMAASKGD